MTLFRKKPKPAKRAPSAKAQRKRRVSPSDVLVALVVLIVAGGAAYLPWYAMKGGHGFGIRNDGMLRLSGHRNDIAGFGAYGRVHPLGNVSNFIAAQSDFKDLKTGTIPEISHTIDEAKKANKPKEQAFPGQPFRVLYVANGQALISDNSGIYLVGIGSTLPDNSTLKGFKRDNGHWAVVTSEGNVVGP